MANKIDIDSGTYEILPVVIRRRFDGLSDNSIRAVASCMAEDEQKSNDISQKFAIARLACLGGLVDIKRIGILSEGSLYVTDPLISDWRLLYPLGVSRQTVSLAMQAELQNGGKYDFVQMKPIKRSLLDSTVQVAEVKAVYDSKSTRLLYDEFAHIVSGSNDDEIIDKVTEMHDYA